MTPETFDAICEMIAAGKSLRAACKKHGCFTTQFLRIVEKDSGKREQYARARRDQADHYADEIIEIADQEPDYNVARVRIDARKWTAGKLRPKKYGDKVMNEHTGKDGGPIEHKASVDWSSVPDTALEAIIAARRSEPDNGGS